MLSNLLGRSGATVLSSLGVGLFSFAAIGPLILGALNSAVALLGQIPSDLMQLVLLGGFGTSINIVGSAILTRIAISSASVGVMKK